MTALYPRIALYLLAFLIFSGGAGAQNGGIHYKPATDDVNRQAEGILRTLFELPAGDASIPSFFSNAVVCGPTLWADLKKTPPINPENGKPVVSMIQGPRPQRADGRGLLQAEHKIAFWKAFRAQFKDAAPKAIRKANDIEINYFWATIPFDIEEPLYTLDFGDRQVIVNFSLKDGAPKVFWVDTVGDLRTLAGYDSQTPFGKVTTAAPAPRPVEKPAAPPVEWKPYQYDFADKYTVSFVLPKFPGTGTDETMSIKLDKLIRLKSHSFEAFTQSAGSFVVTCARNPTLPLSSLDEAQRKMVATELAGVSVRVLAQTFKDAGRDEKVTFNPPQVIQNTKFPTYEQIASVGPITIRVRVIFVGETLYFASALTSPESPKEAIETYFERFSVTER